MGVAEIIVLILKILAAFVPLVVGAIYARQKLKKKAAEREEDLDSREKALLARIAEEQRLRSDSRKRQWAVANAKYEFKSDGLASEFDEMPAKLKALAFDFILMSNEWGITPVVTRIREKVEGSSGVHEAGRGIDFRDKIGKKRLYTVKQRNQLVRVLNEKHPYGKGKPAVLWHSFQGGPHHFHLQSPS